MIVSNNDGNDKNNYLKGNSYDKEIEKSGNKFDRDSLLWFFGQCFKIFDIFIDYILSSYCFIEFLYENISVYK